MPRPKNPRLAQIERAHTYHKPANAQVSSDLDKIRAQFKALAVKLHKVLPESREASLAFTNLEQASMFAIAAVVRENGEPSTSAAVNGDAAPKRSVKKRTPKAV